MTDKEILQRTLDALNRVMSHGSAVQDAKNILIAALEKLLAQPQRTHWEGCEEVHLECKQPEQEPVTHTLNCVCGAVWDVSPDGVEEMVHAPNPPQRKPLTDEMVKRMKENCTSMEMRGAFADGWLSAEVAHGIKGEA